MSLRKRVKLPLEALQPFMFTLPAEGSLLDLSQLFGNSQAVELEVGFGKGAFLMAMAPLHPEVNYLGIEIDKALALYVASRLAKRNYAHVKVAFGDAGRLLAQHLPDGVLQAIHVYFPDPWWKKRHRKRRVFQDAFAEQAARVIKSGGMLHLATDVAEYFQVMLGVATRRPEFNLVEAGREENSHNQHCVETNFERKARLEGRPVWRAKLIRHSR